ncbi:PRC-barrel domain-containing protein [Paraburkholderia sp. BL10I2N1]|uniref:PRC-barrel domain-containing protein n=1 Tax=Paraburkholderia sp. BL10I2N1 TaxID=1938796 RepID=UPI001414E37B|nr:PRC-barrel domain-containing protein [Paraburkholderia sp. BL10I2N1]
MSIFSSSFVFLPRRSRFSVVGYAALDARYRASKIIGATVYNEDKDAIGTIDDLIINSKDGAAYAILSWADFSGWASISLRFRSAACRQLITRYVSQAQARIR